MFKLFSKKRKDLFKIEYISGGRLFDDKLEFAKAFILEELVHADSVSNALAVFAKYHVVSSNFCIVSIRRCSSISA